jgi:DNA-3-methyladenine glycosylase I
MWLHLSVDYTSPLVLRDEGFVSLRTVTARHSLTLDEQGVARCWWAGNDPLYVSYHDHEWGFPVTDDVLLFEKLSLEGFQAGLSWLTILRKRDNFRAVFASFDFRQVANFGERDVIRLLDDVGIVRHRGKIEATINNATRAIDLVEEFGSLASYAWGFAPDRPEPPAELPTITPESTAMSKDLKHRGWRFVGPTTIYAFMQAMGLVNDHLAGCVVRPEAEAARRAMGR